MLDIFEIAKEEGKVETTRDMLLADLIERFSIISA